MIKLVGGGHLEDTDGRRVNLHAALNREYEEGVRVGVVIGLVYAAVGLAALVLVGGSVWYFVPTTPEPPTRVCPSIPDGEPGCL